MAVILSRNIDAIILLVGCGYEIIITRRPWDNVILFKIYQIFMSS